MNMIALKEDMNRERRTSAFSVRIDALEAALCSFAPHDFQSLIGLHRQIHGVRQAAEAMGLDELAGAAGRALEAGALDARVCVDELLRQARNAARTHRPHVPPARDELDEETGLFNAEAFGRRLAELRRSETATAVVATLQVADFEAVRLEYGEQTAHRLVAHLGAILEQHLRSEDCVAHMRDDEFAVLLAGEDLHAFDAAMKRIDQVVVSMPFAFPDGRTEHIRIRSSGVPLKPGKEEAEKQAAAGIRVGLISQSSSTKKVLGAKLNHEGYTVANTGGCDGPWYAHLRDHKTHVLILEEDATVLRGTLSGLRAELGHKRTPILVLVRDVEEGYAAMEEGASDFLLKPIDLELTLKTVRRFVERGVHTSSCSGVLVASDNLCQLIGIGSSLQRQAGYSVRFGRGINDALDQMRRCKPDTAIIDMALGHTSAQQLCCCLLEQRPDASVILLAAEDERAEALALTHPRVAGTLAKPVPLLALPAHLRRMTGFAPQTSLSASAGLLRSEILRVLAERLSVAERLAAPN